MYFWILTLFCDTVVTSDTRGTHQVNSNQGLFWIWAQPMRDDVTMQRSLSLAKPMHRMTRGNDQLLNICRKATQDKRWVELNQSQAKRVWINWSGLIAVICFHMVDSIMTQAIWWTIAQIKQFKWNQYGPDAVKLGWIICDFLIPNQRFIYISDRAFVSCSRGYAVYVNI